MAKKYPKQLNLDRNIFKVRRNGEDMEVCFSDLSETEKDIVLSSKQTIFLRQLCRDLAKELRSFAEEVEDSVENR